MYRNHVFKVVCLLCCSSVISCDAMHAKQVKKIFFASKNIFQKQVRKYSMDELKFVYSLAYDSMAKVRQDKNFILTRAKKIYEKLPTIQEKYNFLYLVSYHARGLRLAGDGDCTNTSLDKYCRRYSALVHESLLEQYKEECKKEDVEYYFPGTYEKIYEIERDKR